MLRPSMRPSMQLGEISEGSEKSKPSLLESPIQSPVKKISKFQKRPSKDCSLDFNMAAYLNEKQGALTGKSPPPGFQNNSQYLSEQVIRTPTKIKSPQYQQYQMHLPPITPSNLGHRSGSVQMTPMNFTDRAQPSSVLFDSQEKIGSQKVST